MEKQTKEIDPKLISEIKKIPHSPGVYIYRNSEAEIIYIGKAIDLFKRVHQYFRNSDDLPPKTKILVSQIVHIETIKTLSEFDALLLEAKLIYQNQPKYNILAKDDKSPLYIQITFSEDLPRILFVRKPRQPTYGMTTEKRDIFFGPFQSGRMARSIVHSIRHIVPFCMQKKRNGKPCFYTQLKLCSPCPSEIIGLSDVSIKAKLTREYRRNLFTIKDILSGNSLKMVNKLELDMKIAAKAEDFERAVIKRNQIMALHQLLERHYDPMVYVGGDSRIEQIAQTEISELRTDLLRIYPDLKILTRIECIDISNISGLFATGSLVVLTNGVPDKNEYRRFKIQTSDTPDDFAMIAEVVARRFKHPEWNFPDLLVVDGGKGQVSSAQSVLLKNNLNIPLIGLAKRDEEIVFLNNGKYTIIRLPLSSLGLHVLQRIRDEAHRFAITYHRKLRKII